MGKRRIKFEEDVLVETAKSVDPLYWVIDAPTSNGLPHLLAAQEEYRKEKTCTSKDTFYSQKEAAKAALMARVNTRHRNIHEYVCPYCSNWHIGHSFSD